MKNYVVTVTDNQQTDKTDHQPAIQPARPTDRQTDKTHVFCSLPFHIWSMTYFYFQHKFQGYLIPCMCPLTSEDETKQNKTKQKDRSVTGTWDEDGLRQDEQRQTNSLTDRQIYIYIRIYTFCCLHFHIRCIANLYFEYHAFNTNSEATFSCALVTSKGRHVRGRQIEIGWTNTLWQTNSLTDRQTYMLYLCYLPFHIIWYMTYFYFQHKFWGNLTLCPCSTDIRRWDKTKNKPKTDRW